MKSAKNVYVGSLPKYRALPDGAIYAVPDDELIWSGARIVDFDAGLVFDVHVSPESGRQEITRLVVEVLDPDPDIVKRMMPPAMRKMAKGPFPRFVTSALMRRVSVETLARLTADHIAAQERQPGTDGDGRPIYARTAATGDPSVEQVAHAYNNGKSAAQIAEMYGVNKQKIDRRLRKARYTFDPPLVDPPTSGRKRKTSTQPVTDVEGEEPSPLSLSP